jgi:hypothetical protein
MLAAAEVFLGALEELQRSLWNYRVAMGNMRTTRELAEGAVPDSANAQSVVADSLEDAEARTKDYADAVDHVADVVLPARENIQRTRATIPRLTVLFAGKSDAGAVVRAAEQALETCLDQFSAIDAFGAASTEEVDAANDRISGYAQSVHRALESFALLVSKEVRA